MRLSKAQERIVNNEYGAVWIAVGIPTPPRWVWFKEYRVDGRRIQFKCSYRTIKPLIDSGVLKKVRNLYGGLATLYRLDREKGRREEGEG